MTRTKAVLPPLYLIIFQPSSRQNGAAKKEHAEWEQRAEEHHKNAQENASDETAQSFFLCSRFSSDPADYIQLLLRSNMQSQDKAAMMIKEGSVVGIRDWGYPGFLTAKEFEIFVSSAVMPRKKPSNTGNDYI